MQQLNEAGLIEAGDDSRGLRRPSSTARRTLGRPASPDSNREAKQNLTQRLKTIETTAN